MDTSTPKFSSDLIKGPIEHGETAEDPSSNSLDELSGLITTLKRKIETKRSKLELGKKMLAGTSIICIICGFMGLC